MALVCRTLGVPRHRLYYRRCPRPQRRRARRAPPAEVLQEVLAECPPSYGYRRVRALLRRRGVRCNPKTVYKWLKERRMLASHRRPTPPKPGRLHTGKVTVPLSNRRWACDITTLACENKERLRLAVILDCADRMVLAWRLAPRVLAEDVGELVREAVHARFGFERQRARGLEFLTDNGPEFASSTLRNLLTRLGLLACHTPRRSPESNGAVEAFFGSLKRDYVAHHELPTAAHAATLMPAWIAHYNQVAPHGSLAMCSPAEAYAHFLQTQNLHPNSPTNSPSRPVES